jgi:prolyl 4-hydroxylase
MRENIFIRPPCYTKDGFKKLKIPKEIYCDIKEEYSSMSFEMRPISDHDYHYEYGQNLIGSVAVKGLEIPYYYRCQLSRKLVDKIYETLTPMMEDWSGVKLQKTYHYGIRSYINNSILMLHRDRVDTHIISCNIFVDAEYKVNWPLDFYDHQHKHHEVYFDDGDMLFYESLLVHGRETPFQGKYYRNVYFHWMPINWDDGKFIHMKKEFKDRNRFLSYYDREF